MKKKIFTSLLALALLLSLVGSREGAAASSPAQAVSQEVARTLAAEEEGHRLFALHRSTNANMVVYEAMLRNGVFDPHEPIHAYWVMLERGGGTEELTRLERNRAYGVEIIDKSPERVSFALVSLPSRPITVILTPDGPEALIDLQGERAQLRSVYVAAKEGGLIPGVRYVEVSGRSLATGKPLTERFLP